MNTAVKDNRRLRIWEMALLIGLAACLLAGTMALGTQDRLSGKVVRLHVLANSDSEEDQALKLLVRDRVLERASAILEEASDRQEAESLLRRALPELEAAAAREIAANGRAYPVTAEVVEAAFPTKEYEGFTLPAGRYLALRIVIGQGAGQNWWCVVFPPLCVSADVPAAALQAGFTEDEVSLITEENEGYVLKFKAVEWWNALRSALDGGE